MLFTNFFENCIILLGCSFVCVTKLKVWGDIMVPLLVEALSYNKRIWPDIDRLYETNKLEFYKCMLESEFFGNHVIHEGDIRREEYARKVLGIVAYAAKTMDKRFDNEIIELIRKGWPRAFAYVTRIYENGGEVSIENYLKELFRYNPKITDDDVNTELFIVYVLAKSVGCPIADAGFLETVIRERLEHGKVDSDVRFSYKNFPDKFKDNVAALRRLIFSEYGIMSHPNDVLNSRDDTVRKITEVIGLIADTEGLSLHSLFNDLKFNSLDIDEIVGAYFHVYRNKDRSEAVKHFVWGAIVKGLLRVYNEAKELYFKTDRFVSEFNEAQLKELQTENNVLRKRVNELETMISNVREEMEKSYLSEIVQLQKKINVLEKELEEERGKLYELHALREFVFNLNKDDYQLQDDTDSDEINPVTENIVIVGGHPQWQAKIKKYLPNAKFVNTTSFDSRIFDNVELVVFCTWYMSHAMYYKAIEEVRRRELKICYVNNANERYVMKQIELLLS